MGGGNASRERKGKDFTIKDSLCPVAFKVSLQGKKLKIPFLRHLVFLNW